MPAALPLLPQSFGPLAPRTLAFSTAGDAANGLLPFGWNVTDFQTWTLVYLGVSSLAFVLVWLVGYLRR
ncbi:MULTISPECIES: 5'-phosphoribosylglycinamide transformylase [Cyanophyceae]|jgi:hypothetical protein|uniref:5'-phosphoribosylglycinamide transformylase n=1 Tax=Aphanothece cf. minutissima CCALA 015 TaxID=2107695 RepID=A0ABX5F8X9_9CHRO|nr:MULTISPECIES: 5'-phosphoribosylglycinamide transformylase [Cyanophyceae]MCP9797124.1 5'-phosphoribosylglycinamide transformylase [Cyanobium sp. Lug-B]MCP9933407.1 5'-phosphoribosylglycinamide transformylase [Cyanobium sp. Candia 9D4]PSB36794.1 5'-phosphoribosylglycinamide transformylase [Aphanothece cf. minutissima CCALA 015]